MFKDLRYAVRLVRRAPGFAALIASVLGVTAGLATAVFSLTDRVLLRPMPFGDQGRLAVLWAADERTPIIEISYPDFLDVRAQSRVFADAAAHNTTSWPMRVTAAGDPAELAGAAVTGSLFPVLAARPILGRTILPADEDGGAPRVALLSHAVWQERFGSDPRVVGRTIHLDGRVHAIVGVMPAAFDYPAGSQLWVPLKRYLDDTLPADARANLRRIGFLYVVARLAPGATFEEAEAETNATLANLSAKHGIWKERRAIVTPLVRHILGPARPVLLLVSGVVAVLLVLACLNIAGLVLVRAWSRDRELALRAALGASRLDMARMLAAEAVVVGTLAVGAAAFTAEACLAVVMRLAPPVLLRGEALALDVRALLIACAVTFPAAIAGGLWPVAIAPRSAIGGRLAGSGPRTTELSTGGGRRVLIAWEVALTLTVLGAAGLAVRSFVEMTAIDPGYRTSGLVFVDAPLSAERQAVPDGGRAYAAQLERRLAALPGIERVGGVSLKPLELGPIGDDAVVQLETQTSAEARSNPYVNYLTVTPGYFDAMGISLVRGRLFTERDLDPVTTARDPVIVVSETTARRLWGTADVVGKRLRLPRGSSTGPFSTVVGVAEAVRHRELDRTRLDVYAPGAVVPTWVLRTAGASGAAAAAAAARDAIREIASDQPVEVTTIERLIGGATRPWRFMSAMLGAFAAVALVLAVSGVYGLLAYAVSTRRTEFGVRLALGAAPGDIGRLVLRSVAGVALIGLGFGVAGALLAAQAMRSVLFGIGPADPLALAGAVVLLAAGILAAALVPARRAATVDPLIAMRVE